MPDFDDSTEVTQEAYRLIASTYATTHTAATLPDFWREQLGRFANAVRANPAYRADPLLPVVDIGCGPGRDALLLAQMGFDVLATDISEAMLAEARKRCQGQAGAERISFRQMDMRALDLPAASCAGLWVSASLLHIPKRENPIVLQELARVLAAGSAMLLIVKELDGGADQRYDSNQATGDTRFFARYRGSELWALLEQAGLEVIEMTTAIDTRAADQPRWLGALATQGRVRKDRIFPVYSTGQ